MCDEEQPMEVDMVDGDDVTTDTSSSFYPGVIQRHSQEPQETPRPEPLPLLLSFPGYLGKSTPVRGRKRVSPYEAVSTRTVFMKFYLVNKYMDRTPKPREELSLYAAGMGRRTVMLPENADHSEVTRLLTEQYPKLSSLSGGWLLYKALGGSGQRRLTLVPPGAVGYDTRYLRSVSGGAKSTLYIVPLQKELDTAQFQEVPKTTCHTCGLSVPLQDLAGHVSSCFTARLSRENHLDNSVQVKRIISLSSNTVSVHQSLQVLELYNNRSQFIHPSIPLFIQSFIHSSKSSAAVSAVQDYLSATPTAAANTRTPSTEAPCPICQISFPLDFLNTHASWCCDRSSENTVGNSVKAPCPICGITFPLGCLPLHASLCGDSRTEDTPLRGREDSAPVTSGIQSVDDVLQTIAAAVSRGSSTFEVTVSRYNMVERGLAQWQRQKKSSPVNPLKVVFLGEAGIDTGALRKEFLTGMIEGIEARFFEGGRSGRRPKYSLCDLDRGHFKTIGEIMAASLAQGGPPPRFLALWCYTFLCRGSLDFKNLDKSDLGDDQYGDLISKVESASDLTITDLTDDIVSCGYTGAISTERKEEITRAVLLHATLKLIPMLQQIRVGLQLYGLGDLMSKHPEICQPLFVPGAEMTVDADFVMSVCQACFSTKGSYKEQREVTLMNHLQDLLQELEQNGDPPRLPESAPPLMTPRTFLQWVTGQGHVPILGREKAGFSISVRFNHHCDADFSGHRICYPTVAACSSTITLPVKHMLTYESFKLIMMEAEQAEEESGRVLDSVDCGNWKSWFWVGNSSEDMWRDKLTDKRKLRCGHEFCGECLEASVKNVGEVCPVCKDIFGILLGNQPDGIMEIYNCTYSLPGYPDCGTIEIEYFIPYGIQTEKHPNPGKDFSGSQRLAFLPDNHEGREVLKLLQRAFDQRLTFTVGTSVTSGEENTIIWNDIHHKTSTTGGPEHHGYPDPHYLSRVKAELKAKGIDEATIGMLEPMDTGPDSIMDLYTAGGAGPRQDDAMNPTPSLVNISLERAPPLPQICIDIYTSGDGGAAGGAEPSAPLDTAKVNIRVEWTEEIPSRWEKRLQKALQSWSSGTLSKHVGEKCDVMSLRLLDDPVHAVVEISPSRGLDVLKELKTGTITFKDLKLDTVVHFLLDEATPLSNPQQSVPRVEERRGSVPGVDMFCSANIDLDRFPPSTQAELLRRFGNHRTGNKLAFAGSLDTIQKTYREVCEIVGGSKSGTATAAARGDPNGAETPQLAERSGDPPALTVPIPQFWYFSHAFRKELRQFEEQWGVRVNPELSVSIKAEGQSRRDSVQEAAQKFTDFYLNTTGSLKSTEIHQTQLESEYVKEVVRHVQIDQTKMMLNLSAGRCQLFGPGPVISAVQKQMNLESHMETGRSFSDDRANMETEFSNAEGRSWSSQTAKPVEMDIRESPDPIVMSEIHYELIQKTSQKQIQDIEIKYGVLFTAAPSQGSVKVTVKSNNEHVSLKSHALRAFTRLYQKVATSAVTCTFKGPAEKKAEKKAVDQALGKLGCPDYFVGIEEKNDSWKLVGLPKHLGPVITEIEKLVGKSVFDDKTKELVGYPGNFPESWGLRGGQQEVGAARWRDRTSLNRGTHGKHESGKSLKEQEGGRDEDCPNCTGTLTDRQKLNCGHQFCRECLTQAVKSMGEICPVCRNVFGKLIGTQPDGKMEFSIQSFSLSGYPRCSTIAIVYTIPGGTQTERHPDPGKPFYGAHFRAYLPDNNEGREVLALLQRAFDQRLIFTIGTSTTTGAENSIIWNDISHKTNTSGGPRSNGYPDPGYFERVKKELKAKGIE
ncbi:hypothetical protein NFI96_022817 [Prochilodus magdalenae]|nr:hypothetical protein NFI96_022817 [Prochilodus magdalenae]